MSAKHGKNLKVKIVLCGKMLFLIIFAYYDFSHHEVSSLSDVYFRKHWESNFDFLPFFNFSSVFQGMQFPDDVTDQISAC